MKKDRNFEKQKSFRFDFRLFSLLLLFLVLFLAFLQITLRTNTLRIDLYKYSDVCFLLSDSERKKGLKDKFLRKNCKYLVFVYSKNDLEKNPIRIFSNKDVRLDFQLLAIDRSLKSVIHKEFHQSKIERLVIKRPLLVIEKIKDKQ